VPFAEIEWDGHSDRSRALDADNVV
jgi:hypothetical protein